MKLGFALPFTDHCGLWVGGGNETLIDHIAARRIVARIAFLFWLCWVLFLLQKTRFELSIGWIQIASESLGIDNGVARGIGLHQAGIAKKLAAVDQTRLHALPYNAREKTLKQLHSPTLARFAEYAVIRYLRVQIQPQKPQPIEPLG